MTVPDILIAGRRIGDDMAPYVIAEMSANHNGSLETAMKIIKAASESGADAVKLQTYTPDTITLNCDSEDFCIHGGLWDGRTLYELYEEASLPWEWHRPLYEYAHKIGITVFSTPFDKTAVDFLEKLETPAYKIASFEAVDIDLIEYVAGTGKPIIISTGMADAEEIKRAITAAKAGGCDQIAILHCVSGYPAPASDYNLNTIRDMKERFGLVTGLSDHTLDNATAIASVALGAAIIEKHFTLDRRDGGPDGSFSLEPDELKNLCMDVKTAWEALGRIDYGKKSSELQNVKFRRSLYFVKDLKEGEIINVDSVRSVRPGYGMSPDKLKWLIGKRVAKNVKANTPVLKNSIIS